MGDVAVLDNIQGLIHFFNIVLKAGRPSTAESELISSLNEQIQAVAPSNLAPVNPVITVGSIAEEYRHIVRERCTCGGAFVSNLQSTARSAMGQFDDINAACVECGNNHLFKFFLGSPLPGPKLHPA